MKNKTKRRDVFKTKKNKRDMRNKKTTKKNMNKRNKRVTLRRNRKGGIIGRPGETLNTDISNVLTQIGTNNNNLNYDPAGYLDCQQIRANKGKITPSPHQLFMSEFINDTFNPPSGKTPVTDGVVLWHNVGSGKTFTSLFSAVKYQNNDPKKIAIVITPAMLTDNYKSENKKLGTNRLRIEDTNYYSSDGLLKYPKRIEEIKEKIGKSDKTLMIIDESQLVISKLYNWLSSNTKVTSGLTDFYNLITRQESGNTRYSDRFREKLKIMCLSGTPIVNNVNELAVLFNILTKSRRFNVLDFSNNYSLTTPIPTYDINQIQSDQVSSINAITINNSDDLKERIYGLISYFGSIQKLMPRIDLSRAEGNPIPPNRVGVDNNGRPLYYIKECPIGKGQYEKILRIYNDIPNIRVPKPGSPETMPNRNAIITNFISSMNDYVCDINTNGYVPFFVDKRLEGDFLNTAYPEAVRSFFTNNMADFQNYLLQTPTYNANNNLDSIKNVSIKYYEVIKKIFENPDERHVVYIENKFLSVPFAKLLQEYLGLTEMIDVPNKTKRVSPSYIFITGKCANGGVGAGGNGLAYNGCEGQLRNDDKTELIDYFNDGNSKNIKVVILNSAAAEGITLKRIRFIHLVTLPSNMSRLFQIIGRGVRNCTHTPPDDTVTPILYLATQPTQQVEDEVRQEFSQQGKVISAEAMAEALELSGNDTTNYVKKVTSNYTAIPYLNLLKEASIDCHLTTGTGTRCYTPSALTEQAAQAADLAASQVLDQDVARREAETKIATTNYLSSPSVAKNRAYAQTKFNLEQNAPQRAFLTKMSTKLEKINEEKIKNQKNKITLPYPSYLDPALNPQLNPGRLFPIYPRKKISTPATSLGTTPSESQGTTPSSSVGTTPSMLSLGTTPSSSEWSTPSSSVGTTPSSSEWSTPSSSEWSTPITTPRGGRRRK